MSWFSYNRAESSLDAQISEDLSLLSGSETSQLESVTELLRNVLQNTASIARIRNFLKAGSEEEKDALTSRHAAGVEKRLH